MDAPPSRLTRWISALAASPLAEPSLEREDMVFDDNDTAAIADRYCAFCDKLHVVPHASVQLFLRLRLHALKPVEKLLPAEKRAEFGDRDLYALCDFLLRDDSEAVFAHWRSLDLEGCFTSPAGCQMLARVLQRPGCHVHTVNVGEQKIGTEGSIALVQATRENPAISRLRLRMSFIGDQGAHEFYSLIEDKQRVRQMREIDLSNNMLSFGACMQLQDAVRNLGESEFKLVLTGNRVLDEVLNASSHAVGVILVIIGAIFLATEVAQANTDWLEHRDGERYNGVIITRGPYTVSCVIYLVSLFVLYLASTLFHATFALDEKVAKIFAIFDQVAIYLLIAGTYTPFLSILFPDKPVYSIGLLSFMWSMAVCGILLAALYDGPFKIGMHIISYLGMGWACVLCASEIYERMSPKPWGLFLLVMGGVLYTAGVPFNVRDKRTFGIPDHTIWHLFVIGGSMMHYFCIYEFIAHFPYDSTDLNDSAL